MRKAVLIGAVLFAAQALAAETAPQLQVVQMGADILDVDQANKRAHGQGNVRAAFQGATLGAQDLLADLKAGTILAQGEVTLEQGDLSLASRDLNYDLNLHSGSLSDARGRAGPVLFGARRAQIMRGQVWGEQAVLTTCDRPQPHYCFKARKISVSKSGRVAVKGAELYYHNRRLLRLPYFRVRGRGGKGLSEGFIPRSGFSTKDGPFVGLKYSFVTFGEVGSSVELRESFRRGLRGVMRASLDRPWGLFALSLATKEDLADPRPATDDPYTGISRTLVDKIPELKANLDRLPLGRIASVRGYAAVGRYFERETGVRDSRAAVTLFLTPNPVKLGGVALEPGLAWRGLAAGGDSQTVSVARLGLRLADSPRGSLHLWHIWRSAHGASPFAFDTVEIQRELSAEGSLPLSHGWAVDGACRYDLDQTRFRDAEIKVSRTAHCLRYATVWRKARKELFFQVELAAF